MTPADTILETARHSASVLLTGPEGPDGDSIGACLVLQAALRTLVPGLRVDVAGSPGFRYT
jgi:nanoRNase/pAp phosphatase (c-di-AMP/oligoRNAs hydrolase)